MSKRIIFFLVFVISFASFAPSVEAATVAEIQALIQKLQQQIADLQKQLTQIQETPASWCHTFNVNLGIGSQGPDVLALKEALAKEGILTDAEFSDEFDEQTASLVVEFQEKYKEEILSSVKLKRGNGFVGKLTRAKLNKLYGCALPSTENKPPVITGIDGPSQLLIGEKGDWTLSIYDPENGKIYITVSWGDGATSKGEKNLVHAYFQAGIYTIQFVVEDEQGLSAKKSVSVNVVSKETKNNPPKILAVNSQSEAKAGQSVTFTAEASDSDNDELAWSVNWDDGTIATTGGCPKYSSGYNYYGKKASWNYKDNHIWSKPGVYTVVFTTSDCQSGTNSYSVKINIEGVTTATSTPSITVISPNGGEKLAGGQIKTIQYKTQNVNNIIIKLCALTPFLEKGYTCHTLGGIPDSGTSALSGIFNWQIDTNDPFIPCNNACKIEIYEVRNGVVSEIFDVSDNYFTIVAGETATTIPSSVCTDSDGGKNIYQMGTAKDADESQTDSCSVYSSNRVLEWWCRDNTYVEGYYEDCPAPYGCYSGFCKLAELGQINPENQLADISKALQKMAEEIKRLLNK